MTNTNSNAAANSVTNVTGHAEQRQPDQLGAGISAPHAPIIAASIAAVVIVLGWVVTHWLILRREREARAHADQDAREDRLRNYEGFLVEKEQITEASDTTAIHDMYFKGDGLLNSGLFRKEATKVRRDFPPERRAEIERLDDAVGRMSPSVIASDSKGTSREKLAGAIRDVLKFIRAA